MSVYNKDESLQILAGDIKDIKIRFHNLVSSKSDAEFLLRLGMLKDKIIEANEFAVKITEP